MSRHSPQRILKTAINRRSTIGIAILVIPLKGIQILHRKKEFLPGCLLPTDADAQGTVCLVIKKRLSVLYFPLPGDAKVQPLHGTDGNAPELLRQQGGGGWGLDESFRKHKMVFIC